MAQKMVDSSLRKPLRKLLLGLGIPSMESSLREACIQSLGKAWRPRVLLQLAGDPGSLRKIVRRHCFRRMCDCQHTLHSRTKNRPKEEVFGTDIPRTSRGHSRGYPGPKLRSGRSKFWKNKHFGTDIHDPKARTSTTLRDFHKLRSEELWAEFSFPIHMQ